MKARGPFEYRLVRGCVEIWDGPPGHPEAEYICMVNQELITQLIATLRLIQDELS